jgi:hypothetical protein
MEVEYRVPFKCGRDGEEWTARLGPVGPRFGFLSFENAERRAELSRDQSPADFGRRLRELLNQPAPLPPPEQAEVVGRTQETRLTEDQVTDFGFECPTCKNNGLVLCPDCRKYFCSGGTQDSAGRFQCQWCGTTLVMVPRDETEPKSPLDVNVSEPRPQVRYRELPPGE